MYTPLMQSRLSEFSDSDAKARQIENDILNNSEVGDIVSGTGGVRKFRMADESRGKGKRGGIRVLFLDLPHVQKTHLLFLLKKGESEDITADEKKAIRDLVVILKKESKP
ncbi:MAG: type II toxin-antitoxin system RelE/ParE family toxin [Pseudobdellovibrionaceae bacterium]